MQRCWSCASYWVCWAFVVTSWTDPYSFPELALDHFTVIIYPGCSGMEGVFIFCFLFSVILLLDWHLFSKWHVFEIYAWGMMYMLMWINTFAYYLFFSSSQLDWRRY